MPELPWYYMCIDQVLTPEVEPGLFHILFQALQVDAWPRGVCTDVFFIFCVCKPLQAASLQQHRQKPNLCNAKLSDAKNKILRPKLRGFSMKPSIFHQVSYTLPYNPQTPSPGPFLACLHIMTTPYPHKWHLPLHLVATPPAARDTAAAAPTSNMQWWEDHQEYLLQQLQPTSGTAYTATVGLMTWCPSGHISPIW